MIFHYCFQLEVLVFVSLNYLIYNFILLNYKTLGMQNDFN